MADTTHYELKRGATGSAFIVVLKDGGVPTDLTGFSSMKFVAKKQGREGRVIDDAICEIFADQVGSRGRVKYEFDETTSNILSGTYDCEFHGQKAGEVYIWPTSKLVPYGKLIVRDSI